MVADGGTGHDSFGDAPWIMKLVDYTTKLLKDGKVRVELRDALVV